MMTVLCRQGGSWGGGQPLLYVANNRLITLPMSCSGVVRKLQVVTENIFRLFLHIRSSIY